MKITLFTSNQPRHINLINSISEFADETYAVVEGSTISPEQVKNSQVSSPNMREYMLNVRTAESQVFGKARIISKQVKTLNIKYGDLNYLIKKDLNQALKSDIFVVFGSSFIKGWLAQYLVEKSALNLHMGLSPYYRGAACNFWAIYDSLPNYVGATIHYLSKGLDSGPIIFHSVPEFDSESPFTFTMKAVKSAQEDLIRFIKIPKPLDCKPVDQNPSLQIRYSKVSDFADTIAKEFLSRKLSSQDLGDMISNSERPNLLNLVR